MDIDTIAKWKRETAKIYGTETEKEAKDFLGRIKSRKKMERGKQ